MHQPVWTAGAGGHAPRKTVVTLVGRVVRSLCRPGEEMVPIIGDFMEQFQDRDLSPQGWRSDVGEDRRSVD